MARFVYIADTHFGANPMGFQQQKGYPEKLPEIVALLDAWIQGEGNIEFILHGGDMVDNAAEDNIRLARQLFSLSVPVYLCLGNHDLDEPDALDTWTALAGEFFPNHAPNFSIHCGDFFVYVMPNQWGRTPYRWHREEQRPHFLPDQLDVASETLAKHPDEVHILATHSPVMAVPTGQTGFDEPYHDPGESFSGVAIDLVRRCPQIRCVLAGHNHINTHVEKDGVHFVTAGGFVETPFEFKVVEVEAGVLKMSTVGLAKNAGFETEYDCDKMYVQGRPKDQGFEIRL